MRTPEACPVLSVKDLLFAPEPTALALAQKWGPAALLHLPANAAVDQALMALGRSTHLLTFHGGRLIERALLMLRAFTNMQLRFLPATPSGLITLGRTEDATLPLLDPTVSKQHATLRWGAEAFVLKDVGSMNGSSVNSVQLDQEHLLADGDLICLGDVQLLFVTSPTLFLQLESLRRSAA